MNMLLMTVSVALMVGSCTAGYIHPRPTYNGGFSRAVHSVPSGHGAGSSIGVVSQGIQSFGLDNSAYGQGAVIVPASGGLVSTNTFTNGYGSNDVYNGYSGGRQVSFSSPVVTTNNHGVRYGYGK